MKRRKKEWIILAIAMIVIMYGAYILLDYQYTEKEITTDSIAFAVPKDSGYSIEGDTIVVKNDYFLVENNAFSNLNVTHLNSSDSKIKALLDSPEGDIELHDCADERYCAVYVHHQFENQSTLLKDNYGNKKTFTEHVIVVSKDSFDRSGPSFTNNTSVWLFDGFDRDFVIHTATKSKVRA